MSHRTIQTTNLSPARALDEFLPERVFNLGVRGDGEGDMLSPDDIRLDSIDHVHRSATVTAPVGGKTVQLWPILAAGFVAIGVTLLALTIFAKYLDRVV